MSEEKDPEEQTFSEAFAELAAECSAISQALKEAEAMDDLEAPTPDQVAVVRKGVLTAYQWLKSTPKDLKEMCADLKKSYGVTAKEVKTLDS